MKYLFLLFFLFSFPAFYVVYGQDCEKLFKIETDKFTKKRLIKNKKSVYMRPHLANSVYAIEFSFYKFEGVDWVNLFIEIYQIRTIGLSQTKNHKVTSPLHKFDFLFDDESSIVGVNVDNTKVGDIGYWVNMNDEKGKTLFEYLKTKKLKAIRVDGISKETNKNNSKQLQDLANCIEKTKL